MQTEKILKAGKIAAQVRDYAKKIIEPGMPLLEIAEKIEAKIVSLGGKSAFPVNLSINDIAAHYTPIPEDKTLALGLLKVDIGVHVDGYIADTAFTLDLESSEENKLLIQAAEEALENAINITNKDTKLKDIGKVIEETISSKGFTPIINLSGHEMQPYDLHAGITVPNIDNKQEGKIGTGLFAIEPFSTTGSGRVYDGKPSTIYQLLEPKMPRSNDARKILSFIQEEYDTLPFCSRWIFKKFGVKALIALKQLEDAGIIHQYQMLVESGHGKVAQAEHTILIEKDNVKVTTG